MKIKKIIVLVLILVFSVACSSSYKELSNNYDNNFTILLHNAGGDKAEVIYRRIGFVPTKDKGAEDEMVLYLTGKKQNKDAGQLWRENYNKLRKKLQKRIKGGKCKTFWKRAPPVFAAPSVLIPSGKGRKKRTRRKSRKKRN